MTTLDDTCRCHCGLHLFDARTGTPAYARHIAHVEAFRAEVQRQIDQALAEWGLPSATTGPCARGVGGRRSQCKQCNAAAVKARYVPRVHPPEQVTCPHCGQEFPRIRTKGALRIYCSRKCTAAAGEERKRERNVGLGPRRCACGVEVTTRVGKPVCPDCRKDPRGTEQLQAKERRRTLAMYGLAQEEWDRLIALQGNACAVCRTTEPGGRGERWHIDHDHVTGQVRGLLCHQCNVGIGNLRDDPQIMMAAARYVAAHRTEAGQQKGRPPGSPPGGRTHAGVSDDRPGGGRRLA